MTPLPNCPARLARFRIELTEVAPDTGSRSAGMLAEPNVPLPCIESIERPGRCVHCQQPTLQAAGAPHGPFCNSIDAGCRECLRLQREAASSASAAPAAPEAPAITSDEHPNAETLEAWRSEADRWQRMNRSDDLPYPGREFTVLCQRVATLIDALTETRAERDRITKVATDAIRRLGTFDSRANALSRKIETLNASVDELRGLVLGSRGVFSSTPVVLETPIADVLIDPERGVRFDLPDGYWGTLPPNKARALALQILKIWPR